ncbi:MAG: glycosyltransferase [Candidatus Levybacteria bacterium]|nr:glycosyltransferase [Candidatus Levybacteria bacterium]
MKKAFIVTVFNEQKSLGKLLDSLLKQTLIPDEIVVVDAGSTDNTIKILKKYSSKFPKNVLKIIVRKGNRSVGRNTAIQNSKAGIIAVSDAGCILDRKWFENITKPLDDKKIDVVAGFYKPIAKNAFQKSLAAYTCFPEDKLTNDFLPSSRSVAFKKSAWESVEGYPEHLDTCEDLVFARNMKKLGLNFFVEKRAIVYWPQRKDLLEAFRQFFSYAKGDGEARYIRFGTPFLYARFIFLFGFIIAPVDLVNKIAVIVVLFTLYSMWAVSKNYRYVKRTDAFLYLPLLQIASDVAVFLGMSYGYLRSIVLK